MYKIAYKKIVHPIFTAPTTFAFFISLSVLLAPLSSQASPSKNLTDHLSATNVILFIGDGMDEHQITMARNYLYGPKGLFAMEQMPIRSSVKVQTLREDKSKQVRHIADSANTASTLATGVLTSKGRIATTALTNHALPTILEDAQRAGYRTGIVTTASLTDATPAAFVSHSPHRDCESPEDMEARHPFIPPTQQCTHNQKKRGGQGSIVEQLINNNVDVLLGGGKKYFKQSVAENTFIEQAQNKGYTLLQTLTDIQGTPNHSKLLGLFSKKHLPTEWIGENYHRAEKIKTNTNGNAIYPKPFSCTTNTRFKNIPTLRQMTDKALQTLSHNNTKGFFLMVEGTSIDKQAHKRNPCGQIGELRAFDESISKGREFASKFSNTLVIVTADHGQAGQIVPLPESYELVSNAVTAPQYPTGYYAVLKTLSGELMAVSYATNSSPQGLWEMHTGTNVPAFMEGPGLKNIPITINQRYINSLMRQHLKLEPVK